MTAIRSRPVLPTIGVVLALASTSCSGEPEPCTAHLDFTLATLADELAVVVSGCTSRGTARNPEVLSLDLDVRPDADPQEPFAIGLEGVGFMPEGPPWLVHTEVYLERNECGRIPLRLHRLDDEPALTLWGSLDAQLSARPGARCEVEIEAQ